MVAFIALVLFCYCVYLLESSFSWWAIGGIVVSVLVAIWYFWHVLNDE
jgi:hypothetical protein